MIDHIIKQTSEYIDQMPKAQRKKYGQFFTSKETALFMAELFHVPSGKTHISVLDPGAGSGILSAALIETLEKRSEIETIDLVCYETDPNVLPVLKLNLEWLCEHTRINISFHIITENYILSQVLEYNGMIGANPSPKNYDLIIGNPPYMKVSKDAPEAKAMPDVCYGAPNLYFLFAAMSLFNLSEQGEMVYIIPRSWTSGAYFKHFRQKLFRESVLEHIHLFVSRDKVFEKESVLQETMIVKLRKTNAMPKSITITTTQSNHDFSSITTFDAPYQLVVSGEDFYVYLVTSQEETDVLKKFAEWKDTLPSLGLKMKTGLTVDFRNWEALRDKAEDRAVPLFYSQHIQNGRVVFPTGKEHEYILTEQPGLLQPNTNYLFVKRFTSKEEARRLQCGVYLARKHPEYDKISTQNKINFITGMDGLSECVAYGLYVLFNSTIYDSYYRILNGSTQVNSTEVNTMPVPSLKTIENMGKELMAVKDMSVTACDQILGSYV